MPQPKSVERVGPYEVAGHLATGGMAEILLGRRVGPMGFERALVIKRILPHLAREPLFRTMFLDEARIAAKIRHPNVVQVHELLHDDESLCIVMEYLEGESVWTLMRRLARRKTHLSPGLSAHVIAEAAAGLHAAHELRDDAGRALGLVHRDVSPQNVFIEYGGAVKVLDFGIAVVRDKSTRTATGQLRGKYEYMSPEQCRAQPLDRRSDVFALGTVLYELSTGRRLFKRSNELLVLKAITEEQPPAPSSLDPEYPPELERIVLRALAKEPAERYADAGEMRRELVHVVTQCCTEPPDEALGRTMRALFPEDEQHKIRMLQQLRAGDGFEPPSSQSLDGDVDLPVATDVAVHRTSARGRAWRGAALVALVATAIVVGVLVRARPADAPASARAGVSALPAAPAPLRRVTIRVESVPAGAEVTIAGSPRGITPLEVELPSSNDTVELSLRLEGHRQLTEQLVPNVDQRLRMVLVPNAPRSVVRAPVRAAPEPKATPSYRRFN